MTQQNRNEGDPMTQAGSSARTLLVVEDNEHQRLLYEEELRDEGYRVLTAADGREALEVAQREHPDLVLLDINMPVMDGLDTLGKLLEVDHHIPVIIHTAYPGYQDSFTSWSADAYVVKSSDLTELKQTVLQLLSRTKE